MSSPLTIGILGGGQLARMSAYSAFRLGLGVAILERSPQSPAAQLAHHEFSGDWEAPAVLDQLAAVSDVITLENEFIDADALAYLEGLGKVVHPGSVTLRRIQDKLVQKQTLQGAGLAVVDFAPIEDADALRAFGAEKGWPLVLKGRRGSYDGYGNRTVQNAGGCEQALEELGHPERGVFAEAWCPFERELAVMVARTASGEEMVYPVVETVQQGHICKEVLAPARVSADVAQRAADLAVAAVRAVDGVGIFGVEQFLLPDGSLRLNEMAPRPHNTGHYSMEACVTSQFENHLRAVLGWPLGSAALVRPAAVMVNLLGKRQGPISVEGLPAVLQDRAAHVHVYGKADARPGRKLGHVTLVGDDLDDCLHRARAVDDALVL